MKPTPDPNHPTVAFVNPVCAPRGDGSYMVQPGKPVTRLTPKQFAAEVGVSPESVRRYIQEGVIPDELVECAGHRKYLIYAQAVPVVKEFFKTRQHA